DPSSLDRQPDEWSRIAIRVRNGEMPPKGAAALSLDQRESFTNWIQRSLTAHACAEGVQPGAAPVRRLNRNEYSATMRDLLHINLDIGHILPADGAGGEGFDNAAETLFLSPLHAEKYMDGAKSALNAAVTDAKARARLMVAKPGDGLTAEQAARRILEAFLPRAFRRPADEADLAPYLALFQSAQKRGDTFQDSVVFALRGVLISPQFLFRAESPNMGPEPRLLDDYALASRLSYFLWGSMPDSMLFDLAAEGKLQNPEVLNWQVGRMLRSPKSLDSVHHFVEQWLGTRELGRSVNPDAKLFPLYTSDEDMRADIGYQPVMFFSELLIKDLSLLNLLDSKFTIATGKLQKLYGLKVKPPRPQASQQPQRIELPEDSHRGGLLGMAAVLTVSSYSHRTSPVLRGKWLLDAILGTPPPPPPPNVPALDEHAGAAAKTLRERLAQHRADPACASCHSRIDPLGFALENFDPIGRWRTTDAEMAIDTRGELPDGTKFEGPDQLKAVLLERKGLFLRNLTRRMLGYALGRGLTLRDSCVVESLVKDVEAADYSAQALIRGIVLSMPFRYQQAALATPARSKGNRSSQ
ncbi:MAG TPA: DUF1588 domain-containing protein, partial [Bryobacteraceae bacterium]|nr:DUF1588 domain-containing protein [Bryobacteraceae bacterium]